MKLKFSFKRIDPIFVITVLALTVYGLVMVFSASAPSAFYAYNDSLYFFKKQAIWAVVGIFTMFIMSAIDYKFIKKTASLLYGLSVLMLIAVPIIGTTVNGAKRWINLGFTTVQPSEFAKIAIIILCTLVLSKIDEMTAKKTWKPILTCCIILGIPAILLIRQPHFSAVLIIVLALAFVMLVAGVPLRLFTPLGAAGLIGGGIVALTATYRIERLLSFVDPFKYKMDKGWQVVQSLYAIGSGGFSGLGLGRSRQKFLYIPEPQNDFIFSIICEELGFIGAMAVIILFAILFWRAARIALKAPDRFSMILTFGLISLTIVQVMLNIAVATSSVPPTGIPLPFFSAGGTSFVFQMIAMGMILNISTQTK